MDGLISLSKKTLAVILLVTLFAFMLPAMLQVQAQGKVCEQCGMMVSPEAQARYVVTDQSGTVHYVECFMCALRLVSEYSQLHIVTSCDWYGPNYTIAVDSKDFGREITVNPPNALFLNGGNCVINRAAYNQTAADALLANGYSEYTLSNQHFALPANTKVANVENAALEYGQTSTTGSSQTNAVLIAVATIGAAVVIASLLALRKLRSPQTKRE